ncbi:MAG TPA: PA2779 family protein, partial [Steroidobacteraceae bacterium]
PADAAARAAALPDADLAQLAKRADKLPVGGDDGLLALIGFVFLVLLLLDYLGVIHVFSNHHR